MDTKVEALTCKEVLGVSWNGDAEILDLLTGVSYMIRGAAPDGYDHTDYQCKTPADTAKKKAAGGGEWNWTPRPVVLRVKGRLIAGATHTFPHSIPVASDADNIVDPPLTRATEKDSNGNWRLGSHFCLYYSDSAIIRGTKIGGGSWDDRMHQTVKQALALGNGDKESEGLTVAQYEEIMKILDALSADVKTTVKQTTDISKRVMPIYPTITDVPEWGREAVTDAIKRGILVGVSAGSLGLSWAEVRSLTLDYRREFGGDSK